MDRCPSIVKRYSWRALYSECMDFEHAVFFLHLRAMWVGEKGDQRILQGPDFLCQIVKILMNVLISEMVDPKLKKVEVQSTYKLFNQK